MINLAIAIFLLPLAAFVVLALFNRRLPRGGDWLVIGAMGAALILALVVFQHAMADVASGHPFYEETQWTWFSLGGGRPSSEVKAGLPPDKAAALERVVESYDGVSSEGYVAVGILLDGLTVVMLVVVTLVSFVVFLFSAGYMKGDVRYGRYYASLALFSTSMIGLVLSDNLLTLYIFWELVGFCSYVLIGHWFERKSASDAAVKAFITTRIGDVGMLIGVLLIYWNVGSFRYTDIFRYVHEVGLSEGVHFWAAVGIFFGAMGKSAQFPLHVWLPDAMEGPTPVSALIHAATMVAAGVYLVGRMHPFFPPAALLVVAYVGAVTAIMSATIAVVMDDIKKVLAYSTISQLGYMMLGLGVGGAGGAVLGFMFGLFHLTTHAFFKAGLFLGSGSVIHAAHHEQSMSQYGGLARKLPITFVTFLLFTLALCGFPYLSSGFFTKDGIIASAIEFGMHPGNESHRILGWIALGAAALTSFYMFRLIFLTFFGKPRNEKLYAHAHESPWVMTVPLVILALLSLGFVGSNKTFGLVSRDNWFSHLVQRPELSDFALATGDAGAASVSHASDAEAHSPATAAHGDEASGHGPEAERAHEIATFGSIGVFLAGLVLAFVLYYLRWIDPARIAAGVRPVHLFLVNKWYMDHLYHAAVVAPYFVAIYIARLFDTYIIDGIVNFWGWFGRVGSWFVGLFDNGVIDGAVNGTAWTTGLGGRVLRLAQTGKVRNYLLILVAGAAVLVFVFVRM